MFKFLLSFWLICSFAYAQDYKQCKGRQPDTFYVQHPTYGGTLDVWPVRTIPRIGYYRELDTIEEIIPRTKYGVQVDFFWTKKGDKHKYKRVRSATLRLPTSRATSPLGDVMLNLDTEIMEKSEDITFKYPIYRMDFEIPWELEEEPDGELLTCLLKAWVCEQDERPVWLRVQDGTNYIKLPTSTKGGADTTVEDRYENKD
jgi:hypothetical protein